MVSSSQLREAVPENTLRFEGHETHSHEVPHLVYAFTGRLRVRIEADEYILREGESLWLAPEVPHAVHVFSGGLALGPMLYPDVLPPQPTTFMGKNRAITAILKGAVFASARSAEEVEPFRLALCNALRKSAVCYFYAPWPQSKLALSIAEQAITGGQTLSELAARHYSSVRQVQRIFLDETGFTFSQWRRRARLNRAYRAAVGGANMDEVLQKSGYASRAGLAKAWAKETPEPFEKLVRAEAVF